MAHYHSPRRRLASSILALFTSPKTFSRTPPLARPSSSSSSTPPKRNRRWLAETKSRLGKCILFGLQGPDIVEAGRIAHILATEWRGLVAGAEGFVVDDGEHGKEVRRKWGMGTVWEQKVLWGDQDTMGHVNNVAYLRYAETSRIYYFRRLAALAPLEHRADWEGMSSSKSVGLILKKITLDYLLPLQYPDTVTLAHALTPSFAADHGEGEIPTITMRTLVLSHTHQRPAARMEEDVPVYDYKKGAKVNVPLWAERVLREASEEEENSRRYWIKRREEVDQAVEGLEGRSVNSGKEEDMGGP